MQTANIVHAIGAILMLGGRGHISWARSAPRLRIDETGYVDPTDLGAQAPRAVLPDVKAGKSGHI